MTTYTLLTEQEIKEKLAELPDWKAQNDQLTAEFTFKDFKQAFAFMSMVALYAENMDHHPEWSNTYNRVRLAFSTHDAGNKITTLDIAMAAYISESARTFAT